MNFSITLIIIIGAVITSLGAFNDRGLFHKLAFSPYDAKRGKWHKVVTHAFVHADIPHLLINMFVLYTFGEAVEESYGYFFGQKGKFYFLLLYVGGILFSTLPAFYKHSDNPSYLAVGASGAVSAVVFSAILMFPQMKLMLLLLPIPMPAFIFGFLYLILEAYLDKRGQSNIAHDAHFYGAIFGLVFTAILNVDFVSNFFNQIALWWNG